MIDDDRIPETVLRDWVATTLRGKGWAVRTEHVLPGPRLLRIDVLAYDHDGQAWIVECKVADHLAGIGQVHHYAACSGVEDAVRVLAVIDIPSELPAHLEATCRAANVHLWKWEPDHIAIRAANMRPLELPFE